MILVYFFGAHAFAWVAKKSVQLWNADVDVPGEKRPLLQRLALEEAYAWQKDVLTKPPTRRRNPEPVKPKQDAKSQDTLKNERLQLLTALKTVYKQQTKEAKKEKLKARAAARGEELPDDFSVSSEDDDDNSSRKSAGKEPEEDDENLSDEAQSIASSSKSKSSKLSSAKSSHKGTATTPKSAEKHKKATPALQSPPVVETPITVPSESDESSESEGEKDDQGDEDEEGSSENEPSSVPDVPDLGADELTEIDLSSAIQRGKFILRARRTESMPPKKRKYTRRVPLASSSGASHAASNGGDASDEEGAAVESRSSAKKPKKPLHKPSSKSSSHASPTAHHPQRASARLASTDTSSTMAAKEREDSYLSSNKGRDRSDGRDSDHSSKILSAEALTEQDELEALKLANTIASRRKLRRSGHHASHEEEVLSLPLPTRQRAKPGTKEASNSPDGSISQPSSSSPQPNPANDPITVDLSEDGEPEVIATVKAPLKPASSTNSAPVAPGPNAVPSPAFAVPSTLSANAKKTGRGKYVRKGKRDANADAAPEPLCASCIMARPNSTRHSLGMYMFYMLEDHIASQRQHAPRYRCLSHRCGQTFYTESELKQHLKTHFERLQKLFTEPPTKKKKISEDEETEPSPTGKSSTESASQTKSNAVEPSSSSGEAKEGEKEKSEGSTNSMDVDTHPSTENGHTKEKEKEAEEESSADEDDKMEIDESSLQTNGNAHSGSAQPGSVIKEVTYYQCDFEGCTTTTGDEEDGAFFPSLSSLQAHITKVHCGGITHRNCSRCNSKNVYSLAPVTTIAGRAARAKNAASVSSHYVHGRGRTLPFEPLQGIAPPNMISLPLQNLSYQPPPAPVASPAVLGVPQMAASHAHLAALAHQHMQMPMGIVDPNLISMANAQMAPNLSNVTPHFTPQQIAALQAGHLPTNGHGLTPKQHQQARQLGLLGVQSVENNFSPSSLASNGTSADSQSDDVDSGDRPKRSTRIRRSSAAAQQMAATQHLTSPYGHLSSKQARAAAQEAREAARAAKAMSAAPSALGGGANVGHGFAASVNSPHFATAPAAHMAPHTAPHGKVVPAGPAHPPKKKKGMYSVSSPTPPPPTVPVAPQLAHVPRAAPQNPMPAQQRAPQPVAGPAAAAATGTDMGSFLDLINLCSSIVE